MAGTCKSIDVVLPKAVVSSFRLLCAQKHITHYALLKTAIDEFNNTHNPDDTTVERYVTESDDRAGLRITISKENCDRISVLARSYSATTSAFVKRCIEHYIVTSGSEGPNTQETATDAGKAPGRIAIAADITSNAAIPVKSRTDSSGTGTPAEEKSSDKSRSNATLKHKPVKGVLDNSGMNFSM